MRIARALYESMPPIYAAIGGFGFFLASLDEQGPRTVTAFAIAVFMEIAALTVFLRRQDYRELSREYSANVIDLDSLTLPGSKT